MKEEKNGLKCFVPVSVDTLCEPASFTNTRIGGVLESFRASCSDFLLKDA